MLHILIDTFRDSILITGIVIIMMMMIESFNLEKHSGFFEKTGGSSLKQVLLAAILGSIPGCIGGFAAVSLYSKRLIGFGALTAMMIASCGDEAFVMLAMMPDRALLIFAILFLLAVFCGTGVDFYIKQRGLRKGAVMEGRDSSLALRMTGKEALRMTGKEALRMTGKEADRMTGKEVPGMGEKNEEGEADSSLTLRMTEKEAERITGEEDRRRSLTLYRVVLTAATVFFAVALACGWLDHSHAAPEKGRMHIDLLSEWWMNMIFAILCIAMAVILCFRPDRFIKETLWHHILSRHLPVIFAWTFGVLLLIGILSEYIDISRWVSSNPAIMILLAVAIGIIPESGPHLIFVSLYAGGLVPFPVLLASCISQDGHSALPLLAEDKKSFAYTKLFKCVIALAAGYGTLLLL